MVNQVFTIRLVHGLGWVSKTKERKKEKKESPCHLSHVPAAGVTSSQALPGFLITAPPRPSPPVPVPEGNSGLQLLSKELDSVDQRHETSTRQHGWFCFGEENNSSRRVILKIELELNDLNSILSRSGMRAS